jgi:hypothetical protein
VSTSASLVPAGTDAVALLRVSVVVEKSRELGGGFGEGCCATPGAVNSRAESSAMACLALDLAEMKFVEIEDEAGRRSLYGDISDTS